MPNLSTYARLALVLTLFQWTAGRADMPPDDVTVVSFKEGVSSLTGFHEGIESVACWGRENKERDIYLLGRAYPTELAQGELVTQRTKAVRDRLIRLGVSPERVLVTDENSKLAQFSYFQKGGQVVIGGEEYKGDLASDCPQSWKLFFSGLSDSDAMLESERLVSEGLMAPITQLHAAIAAKRLSLVKQHLERAKGDLQETKTRERLLEAAVVSGDVSIVQQIIEFGITPGGLSEPGMPMAWLLCRASFRDDLTDSDRLSVAEFLVKSGVPLDVSLRDGGERTALHCAARSGRPRLVAQLLRLGADPNFPEGEGALLYGADTPDIARMLIAAGANPKEEFVTGDTLFHRFHFLVPNDVKWVLGLGLNINQKSYQGETPLDSALRYAPKKVLDAFIKHGATFNRNDPKLARFAYGNMDALVWIIDRGAVLDDPDELLSHAAFAGDRAVPVARALLRRGVDLSKVHTIRPEQSALNRAIEAFSPDLIREIIKMRGLANRATIKPALAKAEQLQAFKSSDALEASSEGHRARERELNTDASMADRQRRKVQILALLKSL